MSASASSPTRLGFAVRCSGARQVARELDLLATIDDHGNAATLPARKPSRRSNRASTQSHAAYARAIEQARDARVPWSELALAFWQPERLVMKSASVAVQLQVSAIATVGPSERGVHVVAHAYADAEGATIPPELVRAIRHALQGRGYTLFAPSRVRVVAASLRSAARGH